VFSSRNQQTSLAGWAKQMSENILGGRAAAEPGSGLSVLGAHFVSRHGRTPCHLLCGDAVGTPGGEGEPDILVPACAWWQALPAPKLVGRSQGSRGGLLPSAQRAARRQGGVGSGNPGRLGRTWGIHPGLAE